ncbi:MAG: hypothetical protein VKQ33_06775 [Candidatus Sericytochromatia bacterium]|nr:hypothetical protein [Candidatus Sericytochromatia bacterium]
MRLSRDAWILAGATAALLLAGCGRKTPPVAAPVLLDDGVVTETPLAPTAFEALSEGSALPAAPASGSPDEGLAPGPVASGAADAVAGSVPEPVASSVTLAPVVADPVASTAEELAALAEDVARRKAEEAEARLRAEEEAREAAEAARQAAEEKARREAEQEAQRKAEELAALTPAFVRAIGEGGLHGALGLALDGANLFVVDNGRTGLLGKFASVRKYEIATGRFLKSVEDIGLLGARNLPTSVDRVKVQGGRILAANPSSTWTFDNTGTLMTTTAGSFDVVTSVAVPGSTDSYRIHAGKLQRVKADGDVRLTLSTFDANGQEETIGNPVALAVDGVGTLFVTDNGSKPRVLVFEAAAR